jgi:hypothetical protein
MFQEVYQVAVEEIHPLWLDCSDWEDKIHLLSETPWREEESVLAPGSHPNSHTINRLLPKDEDLGQAELKDPEAICAGEPL